MLSGLVPSCFAWIVSLDVCDLLYTWEETAFDRFGYEPDFFVPLHVTHVFKFVVGLVVGSFHRIVCQGDLLAATISNRVVGTDLPVLHSSGVAHLLLPHLMVISRLPSIQGHHSSINKAPHQLMGSILSSQLLVMPLDGTSDHLLLLHSPSSRLPMIITDSKDNRLRFTLIILSELRFLVFVEVLVSRWKEHPL
jgi:hypothetical protein